MSFTENIKLEVKEKANFRCCRCQNIGVQVHHIIPQKDGGSDRIDNAAPLCATCHDSFGGNQEKRKEIRQMRDWWYKKATEMFYITPKLSKLEQKIDGLVLATNKAFKPNYDKVSQKYKLLWELEDLISKLKKRNKRVVLTNGCFDLLNAGHIMFFSASRQTGDVLIVALDDDDSVKRLKGEGRPVISAKERVRIISALDVVDYVVVFSTGQLDKLIEIIKPDILTKGTNYNSKEVYGRKLVEKFGGRVELIPVRENFPSKDKLAILRSALKEYNNEIIDTMTLPTAGAIASGVVNSTFPTLKVSVHENVKVTDESLAVTQPKIPDDTDE